MTSATPSGSARPPQPKRATRSGTLRSMLLCALFAVLTAAGAMIRLPLGTVSFTMQLFFTCMAGICLGPFWGALSQLLYILIGLLGIPVFSQGGGLMYLAQPTFGYLLGLIPMAFVTGLLAERQRPSFPRLFFAALVGLFAMYAVGLPYLHFFLGVPTVWQTVVSGCLVFLPTDLLKLLVAARLGCKILPVLRRGHRP